MEAWVVTTYIAGIEMSGGAWLCRADRATAEEIVSIKRFSRIRGESDIRLRPATSADIEQFEADGRVITFDPSYRDWLFQLILPDGDALPSVYRDISLRKFLEIAREKADGISSVFFRPASADELRRDEEERAEYQREAEAEALRTLRKQKVGARIGIAVQIVLTPLLAYCGISILDAHEIGGLCLLGLAGLSALNLAWWLIKYFLYHLSFAIGRGFRDGKGG